jgi:hypothetical protein
MVHSDGKCVTKYLVMAFSILDTQNDTVDDDVKSHLKETLKFTLFDHIAQFGYLQYQLNDLKTKQRSRLFSEKDK